MPASKVVSQKVWTAQGKILSCLCHGPQWISQQPFSTAPGLWARHEKVLERKEEEPTEGWNDPLATALLPPNLIEHPRSPLQAGPLRDRQHHTNKDH